MDHLAVCGSNLLKLGGCLHLSLIHNPEGSDRGRVGSVVGIRSRTIDRRIMSSPPVSSEFDSRWSPNRVPLDKALCFSLSAWLDSASE